MPGCRYEYLGVTPKEFFDVETANPTKATDLLNAVKGLSNEQLDNLRTPFENLSEVSVHVNGE